MGLLSLMENGSKCTLWTLSQPYGCGAMAMLRVIPSDSMLAQRLFSNARYSMWPCLQEGGMDAIKLEGGAPSRISSTVQD
ncbi:putative 3-methyl-2-oxobutanoate hydroxymethyltransferase [Helianthus annuus]|nr:putative 3-methyl-2-oxobutanoate hydroxymethyltransferase [Helianthus annuus]